jgi:hypothetical protein
MYGAIEKLREELARAHDLTVPFIRFHDGLASRAGFMKLGKPARNERLSLMLGEACQRVLGLPLQSVRVKAIHVARAGFWHGQVVAPPCIGSFFYYEALDQGLLGMMRRLDGPVELVRFSALAEGPGLMIAGGPRGQA